MKKFLNKINPFLLKVREDHISAYASQSAYFLFLSLIPIILLLLTLIQYTPVTKADVMLVVVNIFPKTINSMMVSIINQVYNQSRAIIPITAAVAVWSAARGVLAISSGLNAVYDISETRNYLFLRLRAALYTLIFVVAIVLSLVLLVFGNSLSVFVNVHVPILSKVMDFLIRIRIVLAMIVLIVFSVMIYRFLPNNNGVKAPIKYQFPGAVFNAVGWHVASFFFSIYLDVFKGFSDMYGSLTTIILIMLWLYFCMYIMLLGGEINHIVMERKSE